jgi:hypothetical protein
MARMLIELDRVTYSGLTQLAIMENRTTRAQVETLLAKMVAEICTPVLRPESYDREGVGVGEGKP